jgi:hypothetical protein
MLRRALVPLVLLAWSATAAVPTPKSYFGHEIGEDRTVLDWDKVVGYFQALRKSSDRIRVEELGKSTEGRPFIAATIADAETLKHLDRYIAIQQKLSDPRITPQAEAEKLFLEGKAVVLVTCSIHATEIASTHTAVEFAYHILTDNTTHNRAILKDTIVLLVPSLNPDGVDIVTRWYRKTLGTPFEGTSPPELYHHYVGHDNNRDWYIFSQVETRLAISKLHNVWHPEIVYDVHQQGPNASRLFVPPWLDPTEPNIDPILMQEMNMYGTAIASDLTAAGKTGIAIHGVYDFWTPSRHYQAFHGGLRILTESASARIASPITLAPDQISDTALGYNPRERSWNYLEPWTGGTWRLKDIVDYQMIAWDSLLYNAALHREELLRNFYRVEQRQVDRAKPWGFVISANQRDPGATRKLIETLRFGMVEVNRGTDGSAVIPMHQPYGGWAKTLLEVQHYPEDRLYPGGPPKQPYDVTANTLPMLMGVEVRAVDQPVPFSGESRPICMARPRHRRFLADGSQRLDRAEAAADRPLPTVATQHGRRLDALAAGKFRLRLHRSAQRGHPARRPAAEVRRDRFRRPDGQQYGEWLRPQRHAGGIHRRPGHAGRNGAPGVRQCRRQPGVPEWRLGIRHRASGSAGSRGNAGARTGRPLLFPRFPAQHARGHAQSAVLRGSRGDRRLERA